MVGGRRKKKIYIKKKKTEQEKDGVKGTNLRVEIKTNEKL